MPEVHEVLGRMSAFADAVRSGTWRGRRGADRRGRQHRHRRLGPRSGDGVRGAEGLRRPLAHGPVRLERRRHRRGGDARPRSATTTVRRLVEDVHDARDAHERAHGPRVARRRARRGRVSRHFVAVSTNAEAVSAFGIDPRTCSGSGTGWRPLLRGLGDRPGPHARDRAGPLPRVPPRVPTDGRAPARGAARAQPARAPRPALDLVRHLPRRRDARRRPVQPAPRALPRVLQQLGLESLGKSVDQRGTSVPFQTGAVV